MKEKKYVSFDMMRGELPKDKKIHYEWEQTQKRGLEPWHFSALALVLDVLILIMYLFVDQGVALQIPLGYAGLILSVISIIVSYLFLKRKQWSMGITRYTKLLNRTAIGITAAVIGLTLLLTY